MHFSSVGNPQRSLFKGGPSTQCLRVLVPKTTLLVVLGTRDLKHWVLVPSGHDFRGTPNAGILPLSAFSIAGISHWGIALNWLQDGSLYCTIGPYFLILGTRVGKQASFLAISTEAQDRVTNKGGWWRLTGTVILGCRAHDSTVLASGS